MDFSFDSACARVPESVPQHLAANLIDLVLENRQQGLRRTLHGHPERRAITNGNMRAHEFLARSLE